MYISILAENTEGFTGYCGARGWVCVCVGYERVLKIDERPKKCNAAMGSFSTKEGWNDGWCYVEMVLLLWLCHSRSLLNRSGTVRC